MLFRSEVLEKQKYPVRHYTPGGEIIKPYDIASWSLPLHKGVESYEIDTRSEALEASLEKISGVYSLKGNVPDDYYALVFPARNNESYQAIFMAHQKGMEVGFAPEDITTHQQPLEGGAFVIPFSGSKKDEMQQIISEMTVEPFILKDEPAFEVEELKFPRIALVETYTHDMDAGWTRYLFDTYQINYDVLRPDQIPQQDLDGYDVIVFPDNNKSIFLSGSYASDNYYRMSSYPPEFVKGMGKEGLQKVMHFVNQGGKVISWGQSTELFMGKQTISTGDGEEEEETFKLPVSNRADQVRKAGFYCPGSLVQVNLDPNSLLNAGMPETTGIFHRGDPVLQTSIPVFDMDRRVLGHFPEEDILLSGYAEEAGQIAGNPSHIWLKKGKGEIIMFSFRPQFRASTAANYKMIFNGLLFTNQP